MAFLRQIREQLSTHKCLSIVEPCSPVTNTTSLSFTHLLLLTLARFREKEE